MLTSSIDKPVNELSGELRGRDSLADNYQRRGLLCRLGD